MTRLLVPVFERQRLRAWRERILGAKTTQEGDPTVSTIPGARLLFSKAGSAPAPARGRALDHTGIGVKDVNAFCERVAAQGVMCERLFGGAIAMITDPAGVAIEINAGLESRWTRGWTSALPRVPAHGGTEARRLPEGQPPGDTREVTSWLFDCASC